ncbi:hypothetical protein [Actinoplanes italicus]|uniref:hypothetical protein n=1 Tax=Actinoplanes italicus TaxID=113567 RepID=UPI0011B1EE51|nr:hypothetical protein [Actinoplanes italicus]
MELTVEALTAEYEPLKEERTQRLGSMRISDHPPLDRGKPRRGDHRIRTHELVEPGVALPAFRIPSFTVIAVRNHRGDVSILFPQQCRPRSRSCRSSPGESSPMPT